MRTASEYGVRFCWAKLLAFLALILIVCVSVGAEAATVALGALMVKGGGSSDSGYGKCIDNQCGTSWGTADCVKEEPCSAPGSFSTSTQQFYFHSNGTIEYYTTSGTASGYCLDIYQDDPTQGKLDLWTCSGTNQAQLWQYTTSFSNGGVIKATGTNNSGYCIDLNGDSETNGTKLDVASCNSTYAQDFLPAYYTVELKNHNSGQCMYYDGFLGNYQEATCSTSDTTQQFVFLPSMVVPYYHGLLLYQKWINGGTNYGVDWAANTSGTGEQTYPSSSITTTNGWWYFAYGLDADLVNQYSTTSSATWDTLYDNSGSVFEINSWPETSAEGQWTISILGGT